MKRLLVGLLLSSFTSKLLALPKSAGLLTNDFGILTARDLEEEARPAKPKPIDFGSSSAFRVWQCFPTSDILAGCKSWSTDLDSVDMAAELTVHGHDGDLKFYQFHPTDPEDCFKTLSHWQRTINSEKSMCISAGYVTSKGGRSIWQIHRIKTKFYQWFDAISDEEEWRRRR